jgi:DnaJ-class molecular chaperone
MARKTNTVSSNYVQVYSSWNDCPEEECPDCWGTGLTYNEKYDCFTCAGEGVILFPDENEADSRLDTVTDVG